MSAEPITGTHVPSETLAAYLDHRLDAPAAARVESHLAACAACRADMVESRRLLADLGVPVSASARLRRTWPWAAAVAAAAVLLVAVLPRPNVPVAPTSIARDVVRAAPAVLPRIETIEPQQGPVDPAAVVFTWRSVDGVQTYRLTLTDSSGTPVLSRSTTDTSVGMPADHRLARGASYLWYVDALRSDGRTSSTGIRSFTTAR